MNSLRTPLTVPLYYNHYSQNPQWDYLSSPFIKPYQSELSSDRFTQQHPSAVQKQPLFGALQPYNGKYNNALVFTDFNDEASNHEAILQFRDTLDWVLKQRKSKKLNGFSLSKWAEKQDSKKGKNKNKLGSLDVKTFADTPYGNRDYSALTIHRLAARGPNKDIFVHVTDPGVGNGVEHDRSILVTKKYGVLVGPNNGSLGLFSNWLKDKGEKFTLYPIDIKKVQLFEQFRWKNKEYTIPESFHGRDLFVVVAAAIAGGVDPINFVDTERTKRFKTQINPFAKTVSALSLGVGGEKSFYGFRDKTFGNIKTNLTLSQGAQNDEAKKLIEADAHFTITNPENGKSLENIPFKLVFSDVEVGKPLAYLGSTYAKRPNQRFIELAVNASNSANSTTSASEALGLEFGESKALVIKRVK